MTAGRAIVALLVAQMLLLTGCSTSGPVIQIIDPWASQPAGAKAKVIAGFMCIRNDGSSPIRVVGASAKAVERVVIHEIVHEQGIVRMKRVEGVDVAANSTVCLEPEQVHFMLIGINDTIRDGADIRLEIVTASGEKLQAVLPQRALAATD